jgi:3-methyladenine DNA glycosylase/8-oxoguanine DNA glycosylase
LVAESEALGAAELQQMARRVFSLDLDVSAFAASLEGEPDLARALARGGGRMLRAPSVFEDAVKVLLTTNCTWAATRLMVVRLIDLHGTGAFPEPEDVARFSRSRLRNNVRCGYRAEALARFARRVASGKLDLFRWEDPRIPAEEVRQSILLEHGFGPYAAEGLLRILGRHDFLAIDSWIRQQYRRLHPGPKNRTDSSIARRYARYGRFRGLALWLDMTRHWHEDAVSKFKIQGSR